MCLEMKGFVERSCVWCQQPSSIICINGREARRTEAAQTPTESAPGRPPVHREAWSKVSMVLFDRQIVGFDRIINDIRQRTGKVMSRAALIRAIIDGLFDSKFVGLVG